MAIKSFGSITIQDIVDEFGGDVSHGLNEYYRGGAYVPNVLENSTIPTEGSISLDDFYGTVNIFYYRPTANVQELDLIEAAKTAGWNELSILRCQIDGDIWAWSDDTANPAILVKDHPAPVQILNFGKIIGKGGKGGNTRVSGEDGGPAIESQHPNVAITNFSGAYIAGGGGGGGGGGQSGAGGGAGGGRGGNGQAGSGGAGGAINKTGSAGTGGGNPGYGGEAGGAGGSVQERKGTDDRCSGGGGGRILPGLGVNPARPTWPGGFGGKGGQSGGRVGRYSYTSPTVGGFNNHGGAGGGGWGSSGGSAFQTSGGAGGRAIKFDTPANKPSLTNTGTIYGATE